VRRGGNNTSRQLSRQLCLGLIIQLSNDEYLMVSSNQVLGEADGDGEEQADRLILALQALAAAPAELRERHTWVLGLLLLFCSLLREGWT
jgi:hypothetical protein